MITEDDDGKINLVIAHHYASNVKSAGNVVNASRARRLAQEAVTLSNSLPLSYSSTVLVRCDEDRLDVMKVSLFQIVTVQIVDLCEKPRKSNEMNEKQYRKECITLYFVV